MISCSHCHYCLDLLLVKVSVRVTLCGMLTVLRLRHFSLPPLNSEDGGFALLNSLSSSRTSRVEQYSPTWMASSINSEMQSGTLSMIWKARKKLLNVTRGWTGEWITSRWGSTHFYLNECGLEQMLYIPYNISHMCIQWF